MAKRGTPRSIEEYVAKTCAVALKTKRIRQLERENHLLELKIQRYEDNFICNLDKVDFCIRCKEYFDEGDFQKCEVFECGRRVCYDCIGCRNECTDCGKKFCDKCNRHCEVNGCLSRICIACVEKNGDCKHRLCQEHCNPCPLC